MKVIIISGGIGSGKSTVCRMLEDGYGWPVYDADSRVKELYCEHPCLLSDIEKALNGTYRDADGVFRPSLLASRIFSDRNALEKVESLVFPVLTEDFLKWKEAHSDKDFLVLESATILEKPELLHLGDYVAVVDAPLQTRVERAAARDGVSYESVLGRVQNQELMNEISRGMIPEAVSHVIMNDMDLNELAENTRRFVDAVSVQI